MQTNPAIPVAGGTKTLSENWSKADIMELYGLKSSETLYKWLLPIADKINLRRTKQTFTPNQTREILAFLGPPLHTGELKKLLGFS